MYVSTHTLLLCYTLNLSCVDKMSSSRSVAIPAWPKPICLTMYHKVKWSTKLPGEGTNKVIWPTDTLRDEVHYRSWLPEQNTKWVIMVSLDFLGLTIWGPRANFPVCPSPFLHMHAVQELRSCVEVKSILTLGTYVSSAKHWIKAY